MANDQVENKVTRRTFMQQTIAALSGLMAVGYAIPGISYIISPAMEEKAEAWLFMGMIDKVEQGGAPVLFKSTVERKTGWIVDTVEYAAYISTTDNTNYDARSNICTHLGCRVRWINGESVFYCPCHNAQFNEDGSVKDGPPPRPLDEYETKVEDGQIFIKI